MSSAVYRYDPALNAWSRTADYPTPVESGGCGGIVDGIVCAGGDTELDGQGHILKSTYRYHPGIDTWTRAADMPNAVTDASYSSANGELQVVGGDEFHPADYGSSTLTDHAVQYDPVADVWTELPDAPRSTAFSGRSTGCGFSQIGGTETLGFDKYGTAHANTLPGFDQCGDDDVRWLSENRTTVDLPPGHSARIRVTADSEVLTAPGGYAATLSMITDSSYVYRPVPVTLKATVPASWAQVSGTVTDTATGKILPGATVAPVAHGQAPDHGHDRQPRRV
ncbi:hypothetical protein ACWGQ5_45105 [Streptomyces sp. NPDC055722]